MANTVVSPQIGLNIQCQLTLAATGGLQNGTVPIQDQTSLQFVVGTSAGNVNNEYSQTVTIASSGSATTLTVSSLTDNGGASIVMGHVIGWKLTNLDLTQTITVKPGASNGIAWLPTAGVALPPGTSGFPSCIAMVVPPGLACVASTSDQITLSIGAGTNIQCIFTLLGRST